MRKDEGFYPRLFLFSTCFKKLTMSIFVENKEDISLLFLN